MGGWQGGRVRETRECPAGECVCHTRHVTRALQNAHVCVAACACVCARACAHLDVCALHRSACMCAAYTAMLACVVSSHMRCLRLFPSSSALAVAASCPRSAKNLNAGRGTRIVGGMGVRACIRQLGQVIIMSHTRASTATPPQPSPSGVSRAAPGHGIGDALADPQQLVGLLPHAVVQQVRRVVAQGLVDLPGRWGCRCGSRRWGGGPRALGPARGSGLLGCSFSVREGRKVVSPRHNAFLQLRRRAHG